MPLDVIHLPKSSEPIRNGSAITAVTQGGIYQVIHPVINQVPSSGEVYDLYKDRFDDISYYA